MVYSRTKLAKPSQPLRPRHIPQRTCIACRTAQDKRELLRIVRTPVGRVIVDPTGKAAGRGAYLHRDATCWKEGLRKDRLARTLHALISPEDQAALESFMKELVVALPNERGTAQDSKR